MNNCKGCLRREMNCLVYQESKDPKIDLSQCSCNVCILKCNCTERCDEFYLYGESQALDKSSKIHYKRKGNTFLSEKIICTCILTHKEYIESKEI